jgi:hypothetical protein
MILPPQVIECTITFLGRFDMTARRVFSRLPQQIRQLGAILAAMRRASPRLILEVHVGKRLSVVIADDEAGVVMFLNGPRRREAAGRYACVAGRR